MPAPAGHSISWVVIEAADAAATLELGARLARAIRAPLAAPLVIGLRGELGTGKTTLARGFLRELGMSAAVRSPTYTLLEDYFVGGLRVAHVDLFRLRSADELEQLGIRDLLEPDRVLLVEWPERGAGRLPPEDLAIELAFSGFGRRVRIGARTAAGRELLPLLR